MCRSRRVQTRAQIEVPCAERCPTWLPGLSSSNGRVATGKPHPKDYTSQTYLPISQSSDPHPPTLSFTALSLLPANTLTSSTSCTLLVFSELAVTLGI